MNHISKEKKISLPVSQTVQRTTRRVIGYFANFQSLLSCLDAKFLTTKVCENINLAARPFAFLLSATFPFGIHLNLLNSTSFSDTLLTKFDTSKLFPTFYIMFRFSNYSGTISISRLSKQISFINFLSLDQLTSPYQTTE